MKMSYETPQLQLLATNPNDGTLIIGASGQVQDTADSDVDTQNDPSFYLNNAAF